MAVAFARLKEGLPTWSSVLDAPEGVAEELVRCGGLAEVKMERVRAILRDDRVRTDSEPSLEWLHSKPDEEVKAVLTSFKGVGPKTVACVMMFTMGRAECLGMMMSLPWRDMTSASIPSQYRSSRRLRRRSLRWILMQMILLTRPRRAARRSVTRRRK